MAITKVINDAVDLNQTSDYSGLRLPIGTTADVTDTFTTDYLIVAGGGGGGTGITASTIGTGGGGGAGGLRTSFNNSTTTTNNLNFPSGKTAIATYMLNGDATDVSGSYNGTEVNPTYNAGLYGGAAIFNGSNAYIDLPLSTSSLFDGKNTLAVSFWFKTTTTARQRMFTDYAQTSRNCDIIIDSGNIEVETDYNQSTNLKYTSSSTYNDGNWHNIIVSLDQSAGQRTIYIDGSLVDTGTLSTNSWSGTGQKVTLGAFYSSSSGYSQYFDGSIDQLRVYNSALDSTNASNIYNNEVQADSGGGSAAESSLTLTAGTSYTVTIGDGGVGGYAGGANPTNGNDSVFSTITSTGGGAGGNYRNPTSSTYYAQVGGSGGGAAYTGGFSAGAAGTIGQGYQGGDDLGNSGAPAYGHGGGGGAAARGVNGGGTGSGAGGSGLALSITGTSTTYGGGGGGGGINPYPAGAGGSGGGGAGGYGNGNPGYTGAANTGGGGGGAGKTSASGTLPGDGAVGGSGIVILRYPTASVTSFTTTGTLNTPSTTDTVANNNYPTTNSAYYKLDGNANGPLTTTNLGTLDYPSGAGCIALYELNGNANGYLTTTDLSTVNYPTGAGCIALYELNGNAADTSNTYNGGATNVTYDDGAFDQAAVFNGSSSYISANDPNSGGGARSFSAWIKTTSTGFQSIITNGGASHASGLNMFVFNNKLYSTSGNGSGENYGPTSSADVNTGAWVHCALTMSGTAIGSTLKTYINGTLDGTHTTTVAITDTYNAFRIGGRYINGSYAAAWFDGEIDQVRIFNTELTQSQVTTLARGASTSYSGEESNITYDTGAFGKAAVFNGSSSLIAVGSPIPNTDTDVAISAWVRLNSGVSSNMHITGTGITTAASEAPFRATLQYQSANTFRLFALRQVAGTYYLAANSTLTDVTINADTWYHVVWSYNATGRKLSTFLNGTAIDTDVAMSTSGSSVNDSSTVIGSFRSTSGPFFDGDLDQIRFFTSTLTQANVTTLARGAGTSYNGAASNITWQNGRFNKAALFNGSSSRIDLGNNSSNNASVISVSLWFRTSVKTGDHTLINNGGANSGEVGYNLRINSNGYLRFGTNTYGSSLDVTGSVDYANNIWHHVVLSYNAGTYNIYVDGNTTPEISGTNGTFTGTATRPTWIGQFSWTGGNLDYFNGTIDQVRLFLSALSASQAAELYNEHYQTKFIDGTDTALLFTRGTGSITFSGTGPIPPQGAIRTNTSFSEDGSASAIEHYNGTEWKQFDAIKYCTTNTLNFPGGAGCIASYNFNNNVNDIGNTYNGTNSNVTFNASGKFGACGVFNGSNSQVTVTSFSSLTLTQVGISMWVNMPDISQQAGLIARYGSTYREFAIYMYGGTLTASIYYNGNNGNATSITTSTYMSNDTWHHIAYTSDGVNQPRLYIDGTEVGSAQSNNNTYYSSSENLDIGHFAGIAAYNYEGKIDQVRIFSSAISSAQVEELYTKEIACS